VQSSGPDKPPDKLYIDLAIVRKKILMKKKEKE
jgi:hypothetical protein